MINWVIDKTLKQNYTVLHNEILYNKSKTKSCEIMIPNTVGNIKVKTIGIWLSGGVDSAILLYLLSKIIQDNKLDIKIQPATIGFHPVVEEYKDDLMSYISAPECSLGIVNEVSKMLNVDYILPLITYCPDFSKVSLWEEYDNKEKENKENGVWEVIYIGRNANPPNGIYDRSLYDGSSPLAWTYGRNIGTNLQLYVPNGHFWKSRDPNVIHDVISKNGTDIKPFSNVDKKFIAELFEQYNLLDTLLPLTKSCAIASVPGEKGCGKCFHCFEKQYGFGEY
tara:strand:- start:927 stop:1766 length:840 start_codon:yes stop_codon:yes gene_type:complete